MDNFRTKVIIPASPVKITYHAQCMFMGSCFSDYIGRIMLENKYPVLLNPFGTLFNPLSIADNLQHIINAKTFAPGDLLYHNGRWLSFSHYTGFSNADQKECLLNINRYAEKAIQWIRSCNFLILTFGSAWAYIFKSTGKLVSNCHKLPSDSFSKVFLKPDEIITRYDSLLSGLKELNPDLKVVFTLSPVRHWSDGAVNNQLSKSVLHYSIQEVIQNHINCFYFPAYEIFMDELRDYRFYAADMFHPSEQGTRYVWERFCETWLDQESMKIMDEIGSINKAFNHRTVNEQSQEYIQFRRNTLKKIEKLTTSYPFLDFSNEIKAFQG